MSGKAIGMGDPPGCGGQPEKWAGHWDGWATKMSRSPGWAGYQDGPDTRTGHQNGQAT